MPITAKKGNCARFTFPVEGTLCMTPLAIFLISGDAEVERNVTESARRTGHALIVARTAHQAVKMFAHGFEGLRLILMDLDPDVHGVALLNALEDCHGKVPLVALTGCEESYVTRLALRHGAAGCLGKPVALERFERLIGGLCPVVVH